MEEIFNYLHEKMGGASFCIIATDKSLRLKDQMIGVPFVTDVRTCFGGIDVPFQTGFLELAFRTHSMQIMAEEAKRRAGPLQPPPGSIPYDPKMFE